MTSNLSTATAEPFSPLPAHTLFCKVIPNFLSRQECQTLIAESEQRGFSPASDDYPPSYRNNDRQVIDSMDLANNMLARIRGLIPPFLTIEVDSHEGSPWVLDSINERFRFCRYLPGQQFEIHQDGVHYRGRSQQSFLTFLIYLSDASDCEGGDTLFYESGPTASTKPTAKVTPRIGTLIVFDHRLWHAGEGVTSGVKYILRSDLIYQASNQSHPHSAAPFMHGHQGYVWTLEALDDKTFASAGRDTAIHVWAAKGGVLRSLQGHTRSVLGLARLTQGRVASVSRDRSLRIWDWKSGCCLRVVGSAHDAAVLSVVALEGNGLATASADHMIKLWNSDGKTIGDLAGHKGWVWSVDRLPNGQLASASEDGDLRVWDTTSGTCTHVLRGDVPLRSCSVSPCGQRIATASIDGFLCIWQFTGETWEIQNNIRAHDAAVRRVRWVNSNQLASAGEDNHTRLWTIPELRQVLAQSSKNFTTDILKMGDGILDCAYDGQIRWLDSGAATSWDLK